MKRILGVLFVSVLALLLFGCTQPQAKSYICSDGKTIVTSQADCPKTDEEFDSCNKMSAGGSSSYGSSPRDQCFFSLAITRANITLCNKILSSDSYDDYSRASCGSRLAMQSSDASLCTKLLTTVDTSSCYSKYATEVNNYTICEKIADSTSRDSCLSDFMGYGSNVNDWSLCDKFTSKSEKDTCLYYAAEQTSDISYCNNISGTGYNYDKPSCYAKVASSTGDFSTCGNLSTQTDKDQCYYDAGTNYPYSPDACGYIASSAKRQSCMRTANYSSSYY